jgi:hypothetical protein
MKPPQAPKKSPEFSPADYPALRSFLRGYFHQDMKDEYGSPEEAAHEFCADASPDEFAAVSKEWSRFVDQAKGRSLDETNRMLTGPLGSSCILTAEDLERISAVLSRTGRRLGPR